ncbi:VOC family protein [Actinoplanes derwentensis]|uniref:VOC domain-containing protein n=1 Tax=Actinoplanes derwentensis TaxID=113562 RepID=A0A1H1WSZ3_9ACTN|nr:VOC family protein [Actinoplanes derwentensis]SDT00293.1 hypothetical protein SAMN04489716_2225 [Actinoplanes derwentensis]
MASMAQISLGVADAERAGRFWMRALGWVRLPARWAGDDWLVIGPPPGVPGVPIAMDLSGSPIQEQPRIHFDLDAGAVDLDTEVERLVGLGAARVDWPHYPTPDEMGPGEMPFVVLADPEGNRFCVAGRRLAEASLAENPGRKA